MSDLDMTPDEREAFLAGVHVGVLSIQRDGKGPLALPVWYDFVDGQVIIHMAADSAKATLLRRFGRASMTVQNETPPYQYVMIEGPVTIAHEGRDILPMAVRYLGKKLGARYAVQNPPDEQSVIARITPERWLTTNYAKAT